MVADNFLQKQQKQRGRPFAKGRSGNPAGRPRGSRNRSTLAAQMLLQGEAEALTRKAVELALGGDVTALRLCLDRLIAPHRERLMPLALPRMREPADLAASDGSDHCGRRPRVTVAGRGSRTGKSRRYVCQGHRDA